MAHAGTASRQGNLPSVLEIYRPPHVETVKVSHIATNGEVYIPIDKHFDSISECKQTGETLNLLISHASTNSYALGIPSDDVK